MRYLQVIHEYEIPLDIDPSDASAESVINSGISMMEAHMRSLSPRMEGIRSGWKWMPREYRPESYINQPRSAGVDEPDHFEGNLAANIAGGRYPDDSPPHPWDQGLWIFPEDHPLSGMERRAKALYEEESDEESKRYIRNQISRMQMRELKSSE